MKLYATVTSERGKPATKGGNSEIVVNLTVGKREIANIVLRTTGGSITEIADGNTYALEYYPVNRMKGGRIVLDTGTVDLKEAALEISRNHTWGQDWRNKGK